MLRVKGTSKQNAMWRPTVVVRTDMIRTGRFGAPTGEKVRKVGDSFLIRVDEVNG